MFLILLAISLTVALCFIAFQFAVFALPVRMGYALMLRSAGLTAFHDCARNGSIWPGC